MMVSGQDGTVDGMRWQQQLVSRHVILQIINDFLTFVRDWALCVKWALSPICSDTGREPSYSYIRPHPPPSINFGQIR